MNVDVSVKGIARRIMLKKINDTMYKLVDNNVTFYTNIDGSFNDNYYRTYDVLMDAFSIKD